MVPVYAAFSAFTNPSYLLLDAFDGPESWCVDDIYQTQRGNLRGIVQQPALSFLILIRYIVSRNRNML